jgi:polyisoprenoid-binding protein YceI
MKHRAVLALSVLTLASLGAASLAATAPRAQDAPAAASAAMAPSSINLDPVHSMAVFRIQHFGAGFFWGRFNELTGKVEWPLDDTAAPSFDVVAEVKKVDTGSEKLDGNLQGPNFFNQAEFPTIAFKSTGAKRVGERRYAVTGDLTLRGVTKSIEVDCTVTGIGKVPTGQKVGFECAFTINRADFGMKWGIDAPKGALGNEVKMIIALEGDVAKSKD